MNKLPRRRPMFLRFWRSIKLARAQGYDVARARYKSKIDALIRERDSIAAERDVLSAAVSRQFGGAPPIIRHITQDMNIVNLEAQRDNYQWQTKQLAAQVVASDAMFDGAHAALKKALNIACMHGVLLRTRCEDCQRVGERDDLEFDDCWRFVYLPKSGIWESGAALALGQYGEPDERKSDPLTKRGEHTT